MRRVGHAGTLDPMATGVLIVGFGYATRLLNYIVGADKTYEATIRLGQRTTTDDADGDILPWGSAPADAHDLTAASDSLPPQEDVTARLRTLTRDDVERTISERFLGRIEQVPSTFSAIKIHGQRAYDLAREGKDVELEARPVTIHDFTVLDFDIPDNVTDSVNDDAVAYGPYLDLAVRVTCSSGTYIRALARDLGRALGVGGHLTRLRRVRVGSFDVTASNVVTAHTENRTFTNRDGETVTRAKAILDVPNDQATTVADDRRAALLTRVIGMPQAARLTLPHLDITDDEAKELRFGRRIDHVVAEPTAAIAGNDLVAIVERANSRQSKPSVVFPAASEEVVTAAAEPLS
ncbi:tRNA pseudouridine(55) synthase TruB [Bifidobacterium tissieri]|uniref:tRNA pseudouridine synthase B n=2 Tax=Bifidobacterium tissieri TaxID=1630162 RepID=A0A5M9ZV94_9BIFI|nr:tRNA pseudouridine(55) synthase TruB [Bifidobacterium tissieri]KAA8833385.1 tRNA pseudouridine(55) synthase TruB [Bifidobacterium tissieri]